MALLGLFILIWAGFIAATIHWPCRRSDVGVRRELAHVSDPLFRIDLGGLEGCREAQRAQGNRRSKSMIRNERTS